MEQIEYYIIIEVKYKLDNYAPFFELNEKLQKRMEQAGAPGKFDGNEISVDRLDARLTFLSYNPQTTLAYIEDIFPDYPFLKGARILIRQGVSEQSYTDVEIITPDGKRTPLSRFDPDKLSYIPEWRDHNSDYSGDYEYVPEEEEEEDEEEKLKAEVKNDRAEKLYNKWKEIDYLIAAIWDKWDLSGAGNAESVEENEDEDEDDMRLPIDMVEWHREEMRRNSMIIPAKISGAEAGDLYIIRMENAAIIRKAAMDVYLDCHALDESGADKQDVELLRSEINEFRQYFIEWVNGFEKDEFEDEWGLFVQGD